MVQTPKPRPYPKSLQIAVVALALASVATCGEPPSPAVEIKEAGNTWREIEKHEAALVAKVEQIMEDDNRSLTSGLPPGGAASVDAIFDFVAADAGTSTWRREIDRSAPRPSPFDGLDPAEMAARAAELDQIGVVRHWRVPVGQYSGDCVGTGYRAMASVYVVSLSQRSIIDAREISGGEPPQLSITADRGGWGRPPKCDAVGGTPSLDGIMVMRER